MSYGPHQVKMLQDRRQKTSSRTQDYFKNSTQNVYSGLGTKVNSVKVTESLLYDIRRRLIRQRKQRMTKIVIFTCIVVFIIITTLITVL